MGDIIDVKVDDATFLRNLKLYTEKSSKTFIDALNFKLYDGNREAIKQTPAAKKSDIKSKLEAASTKYPDRSVAEMLVIKSQNALGIDNYNLDEEVKKLTASKTSHIAFVKSGWLPGLKVLLAKVGRSFVNVSGVNKPSYGGGQDAKRRGDIIQGSFWNDVSGTGNKSFVTSIKEHGGEAAKQKINSDIVAYLSKKMDIPAEEFNKS